VDTRCAIPPEIDDHFFSTILVQIGGHGAVTNKGNSCQGRRLPALLGLRDGRIDP
jgi:hypothetical protein